MEGKVTKLHKSYQGDDGYDNMAYGIWPHIAQNIFRDYLKVKTEVSL